MAESVFAILYQIGVFITGIITSVFKGLFGSWIESKIGNVLEDKLDIKKKLEKPIGTLRSEQWFADLENDYRYGYIIWNNSKVAAYLLNEENLPLLLKLPEEQENFKQLVMGEHKKFVGRR